MANIAEISVISSAVVGVVGALGGPGLSAWFAEKRETRAGRGTRYDELLSILDDAGRAFMEFNRLTPRPEDLERGTVDLEEVLVEERRVLMMVWANEARIATRVGTTDQLYLKHHDANDVFGHMHVLHRRWAQKPDPAILADLAVVVLDEMPVKLGAFFQESARRVGPDRTP